MRIILICLLLAAASRAFVIDSVVREFLAQSSSATGRDFKVQHTLHERDVGDAYYNNGDFSWGPTMPCTSTPALYNLTNSFHGWQICEQATCVNQLTLNQFFAEFHARLGVELGSHFGKLLIFAIPNVNGSMTTLANTTLGINTTVINERVYSVSQVGAGPKRYRAFGINARGAPDTFCTEEGADLAQFGYPLERINIGRREFSADLAWDHDGNIIAAGSNVYVSATRTIGTLMSFNAGVPVTFGWFDLARTCAWPTCLLNGL